MAEVKFTDLNAVVIGGGTGAPVSIRALLSLGVQTDAVVAMADDGGSTGILREKAGVTPPGDIRKCIAAFASDQSSPLVRAFRYRFPIASNHALGNLILAALEDVCGSFPEAISICESLLDAQGHVYPSTLDHVTLAAKTLDGRILDGQAVACHSKTALDKVELQSVSKIDEGMSISAYEPAVQAIEAADLVVLGPGSLFTSIIPNILIPGIADALKATKAKKVFVCSIADTQGETWGLTALEHVRALLAHGMDGMLDYALIHSAKELRDVPAGGETLSLKSDKDTLDENEAIDEASFEYATRPVLVTYQDVQTIRDMGITVFVRNMADESFPTWHSVEVLSEVLSQILDEISLAKNPVKNPAEAPTENPAQKHAGNSTESPTKNFPEKSRPN